MQENQIFPIPNAYKSFVNAKTLKRALEFCPDILCLAADRKDFWLGFFEGYFSFEIEFGKQLFELGESLPVGRSSFSSEERLLNRAVVYGWLKARSEALKNSRN